jgi:hypothetical protein
MSSLRQQTATRCGPKRLMFENRWAIATPRNSLAYVDIVGVTGSIPVAPTIIMYLIFIISNHQSVSPIRRREPFRNIRITRT